MTQSYLFSIQSLEFMTQSHFFSIYSPKLTTQSRFFSFMTQSHFFSIQSPELTTQSRSSHLWPKVILSTQSLELMTQSCSIFVITTPCFELSLVMCQDKISSLFLLVLRYNSLRSTHYSYFTHIPYTRDLHQRGAYLQTLHFVLLAHDETKLETRGRNHKNGITLCHELKALRGKNDFGPQMR